jgi:hypothetical protein
MRREALPQEKRRLCSAASAQARDARRRARTATERAQEGEHEVRADRRDEARWTGDVRWQGDRRGPSAATPRAHASELGAGGLKKGQTARSRRLARGQRLRVARCRTCSPRSLGSQKRALPRSGRSTRLFKIFPKRTLQVAF